MNLLVDRPEAEKHFRRTNFFKITACLQEKMFWELNRYKLRLVWGEGRDASHVGFGGLLLKHGKVVEYLADAFSTFDLSLLHISVGNSVLVGGRSYLCLFPTSNLLLLHTTAWKYLLHWQSPALIPSRRKASPTRGLLRTARFPWVGGGHG